MNISVLGFTFYCPTIKINLNTGVLYKGSLLLAVINIYNTNEGFIFLNTNFSSQLYSYIRILMIMWLSTIWNTIMKSFWDSDNEITINQFNKLNIRIWTTFLLYLIGRRKIIINNNNNLYNCFISVSYTHLTLPTKA